MGAEKQWYYQLEGERKGPVAEDVLLKEIREGVLQNESKVWTAGMSTWVTVEQAGLSRQTCEPPPLLGDAVSNQWVWTLAFAPFIGAIIELIIRGAMDVATSTIWFIVVGTNCVLATLDENILKKAGHDTKKLGASWLIPVYLFKRAEKLKQNNSYAVIWCVTFAIMMFTPSLLTNALPLRNTAAVAAVRNGHLNGYPEQTLGQAINSFFGDPKWEAITATDGNTYVNVTGSINVGDEPTQVLLQYRVNEDNSFAFNALELDGVPQNNMMYFSLIEAMYGR